MAVSYDKRKKGGYTIFHYPSGHEIGYAFPAGNDWLGRSPHGKKHERIIRRHTRREVAAELELLYLKAVGSKERVWQNLEPVVETCVDLAQKRKKTAVGDL